MGAKLCPSPDGSTTTTTPDGSTTTTTTPKEGNCPSLTGLNYLKVTSCDDEKNWWEVILGERCNLKCQNGAELTDENYKQLRCDIKEGENYWSLIIGDKVTVEELN